MSQKSRLELILFGLGRAGTIHARNLMSNTQVHLKYIVEEFPEKAKQFVADNFLDTEVVHASETDRVLADKSVKAVVVTTPTDFHEAAIMRCVQAGKHVFCEKPIANSYEAIGELSVPHKTKCCDGKITGSDVTLQPDPPPLPSFLPLALLPPIFTSCCCCYKAHMFVLYCFSIYSTVFWSWSE